MVLYHISHERSQNMTYKDQEKSVATIPTGYICRRSKQKYGVCERATYRWAKKYCGIVPEEKHTLTVKEYDMPLRWVEKLENIIAILKTVNCTCGSRVTEKE